MTISRLIYFSIFMMLVIFSLTTYINFTESQKVAENASDLANSSNIVRLSAKLQKNILNMERTMRGYQLTNEKYFISTFDSGKTENLKLIAAIQPLIIKDTAQISRLKNIIVLYSKWVNQFDVGLKSAKPALPTLDQEDEYLRNNNLIKEEVGTNKDLQKQFSELINTEYQKQNNNRVTLIKNGQYTKTVSVLLTLFTIVIVITIAVLLEKQVTTRLKKMITMTDSIGNGNYKVYVADSEHDELSELTKSLNQMTQMLDKHIGMLERKNQELDQFANVVSHDLKAPLRGIENVITWIEEDHKAELPIKVHEYLLIIKRRIHRAGNLIEGILKYARIGRDVQGKENVDVNELLKVITETVLAHKKVNIEIQNNLPVIATEKILLSQVLSNLINNAVKHNNNPYPSVKIYHLEQSNQYKFFVEDNGPGIDPVYHDKIFVIFQTLNTEEAYENTGIGLAMVKKILDERKEQIKVQSTPGHGTTFSFSWSKI